MIPSLPFTPRTIGGPGCCATVSVLDDEAPVVAEAVEGTARPVVAVTLDLGDGPRTMSFADAEVPVLLQALGAARLAIQRAR